MKCIKSALLFLGILSFSINATHGALFVVYGPSGAGKTTLVKEVIKELSSQCDISQIVTYTCRPPRPSEVDGIDYNFISCDEFEEKQNNGFFLHTNEFLGISYGCQKSILDDLNNGKHLIIVWDSNGAKRMAHDIKNTILIWVTAPLHELQARMEKRNGETKEQIVKRLQKAEKEIKKEDEHKMHTYCINNANFESSLSYMTHLIRNEINKAK